MTTGEKRQAARIIRNLRTPERLIFECITLLQDASHDEEGHVDWEGIHLNLASIRDLMAPISCLVTNIQRELRDRRCNPRKDA